MYKYISLIILLLGSSCFAGNLNREYPVQFLCSRISSGNQNITPDNFREIKAPELSDISGLKIISSETNNCFMFYLEENDKTYLIGYSTKNSISEKTEMPPLLQKMIRNNLHYFKNLNQQKKKNPDRPLSPVSPLLSTTWGQGVFYNAECPEAAYAGCAATALAQIFKYWEYPQRGTGSNNYHATNYGSQYANFEKDDYNYSIMPDKLTEHNDETARLIYHIGVSVNMNYSESGSMASNTTVLSAVQKYWDYSKNAVYLAEVQYSDSIWNELIIEEINNQRPVYLAGGAHAFICDGYDEDGLFHINWGWNGSYDGYFAMTNLNPDGTDYSGGLLMIKNLYPNSFDAVKDSLIQLNDLTGNINIPQLAEDKLDIGQYDNESNINWQIEIPGMEKTILFFNNFHLGLGDTLKIYADTGKGKENIREFSGKTYPSYYLINSNAAELEFKANHYTTGQGIDLYYSGLASDCGISEIISPVTKIGGSTKDSIVLKIKNYGYEQLYDIPVEITCNDSLIRYILPETIKPGRSLEFTAAYIDTYQGGLYRISSCTKFLSDSLNTLNDSAVTIIHINNPGTRAYPFWDDFTEKEFINLWDMGNTVYIDNGALSIRSNNWTPGSTISDSADLLQQLGPIDSSSFLIVDFMLSYYNIDSGRYIAAAFTDGSYLEIQCDTGNGLYIPLFSFNENTYVPAEEFCRYYIPLGSFECDSLRLRIYSNIKTLGSLYQYFDRIIVSDKITGNLLSADQTVCENTQPDTIKGGIPRGGLNYFIYQWQKSPDAILWENIIGGTETCFLPEILDDSVGYYRRIAVDYSGLADSSEMVEILTKYRPQKPELAYEKLIICENDTAMDFSVPEIQDADEYNWIISPETAGSIEINGNKCTIRFNEEYRDSVFLYLAALNECGQGPNSDTIIIDIAVPVAAFNSSTEALKVTFNNISENADTFLWDFGDGSSSEEMNPVHTYLSPAEYNVLLIAYKSACSDTASALFTVDAENVDESNAGQLSIYPNPAGPLLTIDNLNYGTYIIEIYNLPGNQVYKKEIINQAASLLDISALPNGIYFLRVQSANERKCFIINKISP